MKKKPKKKIVRKSKKSKNNETLEFTPQNETSTISTTPVDDFPKPNVLPDKEIQLEFPVPLNVVPAVPEVLAANETISMEINFAPFVANSTSKEEIKMNSATATPLKPKKNKKVPSKITPNKNMDVKNDTLEDFPKPKDPNLLFPLDFPHLDIDTSDNANPSSPSSDALKGKIISPDFERLEIKKEEIMDSSSQSIHVTNFPPDLSSTTLKSPSKPQVRVEKVSVSGLPESDVLGTKPAFLIVEAPKSSKLPTHKGTEDAKNGQNLIISVPSDFKNSEKSNNDEQPIGQPLIVNLPFSHPLPLNITITRKKTQRKHSQSSSHPKEDSGTISASNKSPWRIKMRPKSGLKLEQNPSVLPQATPELEPLTPEEKAFNEGRAKSEDQPTKTRTTKSTTSARMTTTTEGMYVTAPGERTTVPLEVLHFPTEEDVSADEPLLSESFEQMVQKTLQEPEAKTMEFSLQEEEGEQFSELYSF
ncbi:unnamed protein product [Cylicostephanus goldi]|uniref:Uncharacterized protein n=1 Tax=Cylicostephanus goldi TaxID=71465 RepID=A0A3P6QP72_CYLGO|nr:unnamed protein product [Cylicostephanus goldi]